MAFLDNPAILLAHIRQAHITSDDTGMCEMVLIDHDVEGGCISSGQYGPGGLSRSCPPFGPDSRRLSPASPASPGSPASVCSFASLISSGGRSECEAPVLEHSQSVDITSGWDFGIRPRSNTAQRLERLRKERQNQVKCKNIPWKDRGTRQSSEEQALLFDKKDFRTKRAEAAATGAATSLLSMRLEKCPHQLNNPFNEFSKFDGKVSPRADDLGSPSGPHFEPPSGSPSGPHFEPPSGSPSGPHFEPPSGSPSGPHFEPPSGSPSGPHFELPSGSPSGPHFEPPSVSSGCKYEPDDGTWEFPFDI